MAARLLDIVIRIPGIDPSLLASSRRRGDLRLVGDRITLHDAGQQIQAPIAIAEFQRAIRSRQQGIGRARRRSRRRCRGSTEQVGGEGHSCARHNRPRRHGNAADATASSSGCAATKRAASSPASASDARATPLRRIERNFATALSKAMRQVPGCTTGLARRSRPATTPVMQARRMPPPFGMAAVRDDGGVGGGLSPSAGQILEGKRLDRADQLAPRRHGIGREEQWAQDRQIRLHGQHRLRAAARLQSIPGARPHRSAMRGLAIARRTGCADEAISSATLSTRSGGGAAREQQHHHDRCLRLGASSSFASLPASCENLLQACCADHHLPRPGLSTMIAQDASECDTQPIVLHAAQAMFAQPLHATPRIGHCPCRNTCSMFPSAHAQRIERDRGDESPSTVSEYSTLGGTLTKALAVHDAVAARASAASWVSIFCDTPSMFAAQFAEALRAAEQQAEISTAICRPRSRAPRVGRWRGRGFQAGRVRAGCEVTSGCLCHFQVPSAAGDAASILLHLRRGASGATAHRPLCKGLREHGHPRTSRSCALLRRRGTRRHAAVGEAFAADVDWHQPGQGSLLGAASRQGSGVRAAGPVHGAQRQAASASTAWGR